jgi:hypothetical protein
MDAFDFENDPITAAQVEVLTGLLVEQWSDRAPDGFLVIAGRFVDHMGNDRTAELAWFYKTHLAIGRLALRRSLEALLAFVGSPRQFEENYPIYINDPRHGSVAAFPQLPILGIDGLTPNLYRAMDSNAKVFETEAPLRDFISREGTLPYLPPPQRLVLRRKPRIHWCSYERYESPAATRSALQILPGYRNDCTLRATLPTTGLDGSVFVAFNGDTTYPDFEPGESMAFAGYYVEVATQDHPELPGGGLQVGVFGSPKVSQLEEWLGTEQRWSTIWRALASTQ